MTPSSVTARVKKGWETQASPQSSTWCTPAPRKTCPSWRSSCWTVSRMPKAASRSHRSAIASAPGSRGSTSSSCARRASYAPGSVGSRRSGSPAASSASTSSSHASWTRAYASSTSSQRSRLRSSTITSRRRGPASASSSHPVSGSLASGMGTRPSESGATSAVTAASWRIASSLALNQTGPPSVGTRRTVDQSVTCGCSIAPTTERPCSASRSAIHARAASRKAGSRHLVVSSDGSGMTRIQPRAGRCGQRGFVRRGGSRPGRRSCRCGARGCRTRRTSSCRWRGPRASRRWRG